MSQSLENYASYSTLAQDVTNTSSLPVNGESLTGTHLRNIGAEIAGAGYVIGKAGLRGTAVAPWSHTSTSLLATSSGTSVVFAVSTPSMAPVGSLIGGAAPTTTGWRVVTAVGVQTITVDRAFDTNLANETVYIHGTMAQYIAAIKATADAASPPNYGTFAISTHTITYTPSAGIPIASSTNGQTQLRTATGGAMSIVLPSGTINQRICGINTTDGSATFGSTNGAAPANGLSPALEWYLYFIYDGSTDMFGISRSPLHKQVPANYIHSISATGFTGVASYATAWDAMLISASGAITVANAKCVCLGPCMTATVDGSSTTAGRFASETLTTNYLPRLNDKRSTVLQHSVRADTANGYGSTDTKIRKMTNAAVTGTAVQCFLAGGASAASSVGGTEYVLTEDGEYAISYTDVFNAASRLGLSVNSAQRTTDVSAITLANCLGAQDTLGNGAHGQVTYTGYFSAGDIIRGHDIATAAGTGQIFMTVTKLGWGANQ